MAIWLFYSCRPKVFKGMNDLSFGILGCLFLTHLCLFSYSSFSYSNYKNTNCSFGGGLGTCLGNNTLLRRSHLDLLHRSEKTQRSSQDNPVKQPPVIREQLIKMPTYLHFYKKGNIPLEGMFVSCKWQQQRLSVYSSEHSARLAKQPGEGWSGVYMFRRWRLRQSWEDKPELLNSKLRISSEKHLLPPSVPWG